MCASSIVSWQRLVFEADSWTCTRLHPSPAASKPHETVSFHQHANTSSPKNLRTVHHKDQSTLHRFDNGAHAQYKELWSATKEITVGRVT